MRTAAVAFLGSADHAARLCHLSPLPPAAVYLLRAHILFSHACGQPVLVGPTLPLTSLPRAHGLGTLHLSSDAGSVRRDYLPATKTLPMFALPVTASRK